MLSDLFFLSFLNSFSGVRTRKKLIIALYKCTWNNKTQGTIQIDI